MIGTGRSETHLLANTISGHRDVSATTEETPIFGYSTQMALNKLFEPQLYPKLVKKYEKKIRTSAAPVYLDKSHADIWLVEKLKATFPSSSFIATTRNPYAVVTSTVEDHGVKAWHDRSREWPVPNRSLRLNITLATTYDQMSIAAKCALRWLAHQGRLRFVKKTLGSDLLVVRYERLLKTSRTVVAEIKEFLELQSGASKIPKIDMQSNRQWQDKLSAENLAMIEDITRLTPEQTADKEKN